MVYLTTLSAYVKRTGLGLISSTIQRLDGEPEQDHDNTRHNSRSSGQDVNLGPPEYEARLIPTEEEEEEVIKIKKEQDEKLKGKNVNMKKHGR